MKTSLNKRIAIFPGTFDPFTIGHMSLVERALNMLDEIVIAIGVNCLTVDLARQCHAGFILRGIRSVNDFEYEKTIADVNRKISGVETLVLFTEPEHTHISSTIVRELLRYGRSVDEFLPEGLVLSR